MIDWHHGVGIFYTKIAYIAGSKTEEEEIEFQSQFQGKPQ